MSFRLYPQTLPPDFGGDTPLHTSPILSTPLCLTWRRPWAGDEILSINGVKLTSVSRQEILEFISETPLTITILIRRQRHAALLEQSEDGGRNFPRSVCGD